MGKLDMTPAELKALHDKQDSDDEKLVREALEKAPAICDLELAALSA